MDAELEAIKKIVSQKKQTRDLNKARRLADDYVAVHPEEFTSYEDMSLEDLVNAVSVMRQAGMDDGVWRLETWLLHRFEPQNIGGAYHATLRQTGAK